MQGIVCLDSHEELTNRYDSTEIFSVYLSTQYRHCKYQLFMIFLEFSSLILQVQLS